MDFQSLGAGNPFYVLRKGEKPILEVGVVKSKSQPRAKFPTATPNIMAGVQIQQVLDVTATINGKDETFNEIPVNVEIAARGNDTFSGSREAMLQAVDSMLQTSKKALEQISYHKGVIAESEKMLEVLNPRYAEEKRQARTIQSLEEKQKATEQQLTAMQSQVGEMLGILRQLNGSPSSGAV
jgi:small-conductance mechanosensitive channel